MQKSVGLQVIIIKLRICSYLNTHFLQPSISINCLLIGN